MTSTLTGAALAALFVATCAMPPAAAAQAKPSDAQAKPSDAQVAPGKWDVMRVRCSDILNADDDDRTTAVMFYYGFVAARHGIKVIDVNKISDNIRKVMKQCEAKPTMTVPEAFRVLLPPPPKK
jgi:hypothetical protein